jgi:hypothetical protein
LSDKPSFELNQRVEVNHYGLGTISEVTNRFHPKYGYGYLVNLDKKQKSKLKLLAWFYEDEIKAAE